MLSLVRLMSVLMEPPKKGHTPILHPLVGQPNSTAGSQMGRETEVKNEARVPSRGTSKKTTTPPDPPFVPQKLLFVPNEKLTFPLATLKLLSLYPPLLTQRSGEKSALTVLPNLVLPPLDTNVPKLLTLMASVL